MDELVDSKPEEELSRDEYLYKIRRDREKKENAVYESRKVFD